MHCIERLLSDLSSKHLGTLVLLLSTPGGNPVPLEPGLHANGDIVRVRFMVIERSRRDFLKQASMLTLL